ncbi:hypothetical protein KR018_004705, partial [Drosophila ironensis]
IMSQRPEFVLDKRSMGIKCPRPASPSSTSVRSQSPKPTSSASSACQPHQSQSNMKKAHGQNLEIARSTSAGHVQCNSNLEPLCTEHYRCLLQKFRDAPGDAEQVNFELNNIFINRLQEIDNLDEQGGDSTHSSQLRLVTFQEWVDFLLNVNNLILGNVNALEEEAYGKIVSCFQAVQGEQQQSLDENRKLRKDLCAIIKLVQNAYHRNCWDTGNLTLETLTVNQLLGVSKDQVPESESEKMSECMKSLVNEMAAKHDEAVFLKSQICSLEDIVQTARQKLLFKDQCIAQLNEQLQELNQCLETMSNPITDHNGDGDQLEASSECDTIAKNDLSNQEMQVSEALRILDKEITDVCELQKIQELQSIEERRKELVGFGITSDRKETEKKLNFIRDQLRLLDLDLNQTSMPQEKSDSDDPDVQLLDAVKRRIHTLSSCKRELECKLQRQSTESKIATSQLKVDFEAECAINKRTSCILKEMAEQICNLSLSEFSYSEIFKDGSTGNPFCEAIASLFEAKSKQEERDEARNEQETADCPHRQQLQDTLLHCQTQSEILQATRDNYLSIIDEFKRDLEELNEQVEQQQQNQQKSIIPTCPEPELHIENPPPHINCELEKQNEILSCQMEGLTILLKERNEQILHLQSMISSYSDVNENNRLKEELRELKTKNTNNSRKMQDLAGQINGQNTQRVELANKYETLAADFEDQSQELKSTKRQIQGLQTRLEQAETRHEELKTERKILREEVIALKEKEAEAAGREKSFQYQMCSGKGELNKSRALIKDLQQQLLQQDCHHREIVQDLEQANEAIRANVRGIGAECQQIQLQLKQQMEVNVKQKQIIQSFRQWKDAQLRADEVMRQCVKRAEEHINILLGENHFLAEDYRKLFDNYQLLECEMKRVKEAVNYGTSTAL